jgi:hypothetical protein
MTSPTIANHSSSSFPPALTFLHTCNFLYTPTRTHTTHTYTYTQILLIDCFTELGATPLLPLSLGDDSEELVDKFHKWSEKVTKKIKATFAGIELKPFFNKNYYESSINPKPEVKKATVAAPPVPALIIKSGDVVTENILSEKNSEKDDTEVFNAKPKKMKFQKNVGKGKVSKANAFQIQQKLVRDEAKTPVVSTDKADVRAVGAVKVESSGGCCGSEGKGKEKAKGKGKAQASGDSCCKSAEVSRV